MPHALRFVACLLLSAVSLLAGPPRRPGWFLAGERIYREGRLPSGAPLQGSIQGDRPVTGLALTCASCHMWSGLGSQEGGANEGGVVIPPVDAPSLFHPRFQALPRIKGADRDRLGLKASPLRPAYSEASLARTLRTGIDPTGRELNAGMPRYHLKPAEMALLIRYLKTLSAAPTPGVDDKILRFATIFGPEVTAADREAMLKPLQAFIAFNNEMPRHFGHRMYRTHAGANLVQDHRTFTLVPWILSGPRATWPRQLEARYRKEPVFALLGGMAAGSWQPIHDFCEAWRIPCLFPITDLPVVSDTNRYTLYFSRGLQQEGEAAARFLAQDAAPEAGTRVVQLVQGKAGEALSLGFETAWRELGRPSARRQTLADGQVLDAAFLKDLIAREQPSALLLWVGPEHLPAMGRPQTADGSALPLLISAGAWGPRVYDLPEDLREATYLTYPYRHPEDEARALRNTVPSLAREADRRDRSRIPSRMYSLVQVLSKALVNLQGAYTRDHLLDRIALLPDQSLPDFERLVFGPGQRYASRGCYIMQLTNGPEPSLVKRSGWLIQ
ncbi:MAG: c-type cytochrome [Geothrix sp.]|nr:c-type cytochrome [Geothrix sp.]